MTNPEKICPGCGRYHYLDIACIGCWPRIPWEIRHAILLGTPRVREEARRMAREWLKANPQR